MAELTNDFSWSFSRQQAFEACRRRYFYRYYLFWEGWRREAPEERRLAYLFSKMQSLSMLVGSAVHRTLEAVLSGHRDGRPLADPVAFLREHLNQTWKDSKEQRWRTLGARRSPPLFEHYYDVPVSRERLAQLRELALGAVQGFLDSDLYRTLLATPPRDWLSIDQRAELLVEGVRTFVAPDFAFVKDGETWLLDWKTGARRPDLPLQLLAYARYAHEVWGRPLETLRAFDVFLSGTRSVEVVEVPVDAAGLEQARRTLLTGAQAMQALLVDAARNQAREEDFSPTENPRECDWCFFQQICTVRPAPVQALPHTRAVG